MKSNLKKVSPRLFGTSPEVSTGAPLTQSAHKGIQTQDGLPWRVKMVAPGSLKPAKRNARTHSKKQIRLIKQSLTRYGVINPVVVDRHGNVIAGHARLSLVKSKHDPPRRYLSPTADFGRRYRRRHGSRSRATHATFWDNCG